MCEYYTMLGSGQTLTSCFDNILNKLPPGYGISLKGFSDILSLVDKLSTVVLIRVLLPMKL